MVAGLPELFEEERRSRKLGMAYSAVVSAMMDQADGAGSFKSPGWCGVFRLQCVLNGMELIPFNNMEPDHNKSWYVWITLEDDEQYFVVPPANFGDSIK